MFERFTTEARRVVVLAQEDAREAADGCIDGAHLLVGIAAAGGPGADGLRAVGIDVARLRTAVRAAGPPGDPLDAAALAALGIDLDQVRETAEAAFGAGALEARRRKRPSGHIPFTSTAKASLTMALRAALRRGDRAIDSRHLLLGVLDAGDRRAGAVLAQLDVEPADLRRRLDAGSDAA